MVDVLDSFITLLSTNWISSNTDNKTPVIQKIFNFKRVDFGFQNKDYVLVYNPNYTQGVNGIGKKSKRVMDRISCDIRVMGELDARSHAMKVRDEIIRITDKFTSLPFGDYNVGEADSIIDLSDKTNKLWRFVIDFRLEALNRVR